MDNEQQSAPIIPAGTEKTVFGTTSFPASNNGQADGSPIADQSAENRQTSEGGAPDGTTFDELAVKKGFSSPDDLARAYANLESQNKRVEMSLAELIKFREPQPEALADDALSSEVASQDEDAVKVVEKVVKRITRPLEDRLHLQELFYKNPDAAQYASEMGKLVKENPGISWDVAYKAAKFDALGNQSRLEGKQEAYQAIRQKEAVAVGSARPVSKETRQVDDLIRDKSIPFSEVQRIMKERFSQ